MYTLLFIVCEEDFIFVLSSGVNEYFWLIFTKSLSIRNIHSFITRIVMIMLLDINNFLMS